MEAPPFSRCRGPGIKPRGGKPQRVSGFPGRAGTGDGWSPARGAQHFGDQLPQSVHLRGVSLGKIILV